MNRRVYTFGDLVRVWKAAELNAKLTNAEWDNSLNPIDYCRNQRRSEGFITLEHFGKWRTLFKAMLPGLTQKNMKQILRDLRKKEKEFRRRQRERYIKAEDANHPSRWMYNLDWNTGVRKHSLIPGRLYPLSQYKYRRALGNWLSRMAADGTVDRMVEELNKKVWTDLEANGYIKVSGPVRTIEPASTLTPSQQNDWVRKVNDDWVEPYRSRRVEEGELRSNNHLHHSIWFAPYKTEEGRGGLLLCIKLPQDHSDFCWKEDVGQFVGPTQRRWIYSPIAILDKLNTVVVNRPEVIKDWDKFVVAERGRDGG